MTHPATITRLNLADALAACTEDELLSLAYGEFAPTPLLADAAYNEHHLRQFGGKLCAS